MAVNTKRLFLYGIFFAALVAAIVGFYLWNKPAVDVANAEAIQTTAVDLYKSFILDSVMANKKYGQKILAVSGTVSRISSNQQNQAVVLLKTESDGAFVNCTMEEKNSAIKENSSISIKGICMGLGQGDADLGIPGDLYLTRCYPEK
jgi:uncharacterized protein (DUF1330 family)